MIKLTIIICTIIILAAYSLIRLKLLSKQLTQWIETTAHLKHHKRYSVNPEGVSNWLNENPSGRDSVIEIIYRYKNKEYLSRKTSPLDYIIPFWGNFNARANAKIMASKFGKELKVWINPNNPKQSLIDKTIKKSGSLTFH